jgi:hypothetical protein
MFATLGIVPFMLSPLALLTFIGARSVRAQSNAGVIEGTVTDPSKAVVPGAKVRIENLASGAAVKTSKTETAMDGTFSIANVPFAPYRLTASAPDSIQGMDVIEGAPTVEYGGKSSVIAKATTRSGPMDAIVIKRTPLKRGSEFEPAKEVSSCATHCSAPLWFL